MKLFLLLPVAAALNILLSLTDSWVSKNARYLYPALIEAGHDVVYVGPLNFEEKGPEETEVSDWALSQRQESSGDFNHLASSNQEYFKNIRKRNVVPRGAKNSISKKDSQAFDEWYSMQKKSAVAKQSYGQDPLNEHFWYVDANPLVALSVALDYILPTHHEEFVPDLVLIGPNEGLHLTPDDSRLSLGFRAEDLLALGDWVQAMRILAQLHDFPVISVSTEDRHHVYFENEELFNVEQPYKRSFKRNTVSQNIEFVNARVVSLVSSVTPLLTPNLALNVNFPSINHQLSGCFTHGTLGPQFAQVAKKNVQATLLGKVYSVPQFTIAGDQVDFVGLRHWKASDAMESAQEILEVEVMRLLHLFEELIANTQFGEQRTVNVLESQALEQCHIAVSVCDITQGNNLASPALFV